MKWAVLSTEGVLTIREDEQTLEAWQEAVGGPVEEIVNEHGLTVLANEEGKQRQLPLNSRATAYLVNTLMPGDRIVGSIIFTGQPDGEGNPTGLSDEYVTRLESRFGHISVRPL